MKHYRLSVSGEVVTKIVGFDSTDPPLYVVAHARDLLRSGDFIFLEKATLEEHNPDRSYTLVAEFAWVNRDWHAVSLPTCI